MTLSVGVYKSDLLETSASGGDTVRTVSYNESLSESEISDAVEIFQALRRWKNERDRKQHPGG